MSEHEGTPRKKQRASRDEETPEGVDPETGEITGQTPAEAADSDGSAELVEKAFTATKNYHEQITAILGDDPNRRECPTCGGTAFVYDEVEATPELVHPDNLVTCDACNGYGSVITGSKAPGRETTVCIACSGNGYKTVTPQHENVTPILPNQAAPVATSGAPVMGWMTPEGVFQPLGTPNASNG